MLEWMYVSFAESQIEDCLGLNLKYADYQTPTLQFLCLLNLCEHKGATFLKCPRVNWRLYM